MGAECTKMTVWTSKSWFFGQWGGCEQLRLDLGFGSRGKGADEGRDTCRNMQIHLKDSRGLGQKAWRGVGVGVQKMPGWGAPVLTGRAVSRTKTTSPSCYGPADANKSVG